MFLSQDLMQFRLAWNLLCLQDSCFDTMCWDYKLVKPHLATWYSESFHTGYDWITAICGRLKE